MPTAHAQRGRRPIATTSCRAPAATPRASSPRPMAERQAAIAEASGQAQRFLSVLKAYDAAKDVTLRRLYIETMQDVLSHTPDDRGRRRTLQGLLPLPAAQRAGATPARPPKPPAAGGGAMSRSVIVAARRGARRGRCSPASSAVHRRPDRAGADHAVRPAGARDRRSRACTSRCRSCRPSISFDRRLLDYEVPPEEVILGDQRRLIVDSFARFRIADPLQYYQAVGADGGGHPRAAQLDRVLGAAPGARQRAVARTCCRRSARRIMGAIRDQVNARDARLRRRRRGRAHPPRRPAGGEHAGGAGAHAVRARSASPRRRAPRAPRPSAKIRANAERERTVLLAEARATADKLRGEGEAKSIAIYAEACRAGSAASSRPGARCRPIARRSPPARRASCSRRATSS